MHTTTRVPPDENTKAKPKSESKLVRPKARLTKARQTPNYKTDTQLQDRHPTTRQTPNYKTDTQLQDRHPTTRQTPNYKTDTQLQEFQSFRHRHI